MLSGVGGGVLGLEQHFLTGTGDFFESIGDMR